MKTHSCPSAQVLPSEMAGLNLFTSRSLPHSTVTQSLSSAPSLFLVKVNWPRSRHKTLMCLNSSLIPDTLIFFFYDPENKTPESLKNNLGNKISGVFVGLSEAAAFISPVKVTCRSRHVESICKLDSVTLKRCALTPVVCLYANY